METKLLFLLCFICVHCIHGSDISDTPQRSNPPWFRVIRAKRTDRIDQTADQKQRRRPKTAAFNENFPLEDLEQNAAEHFKIPLPKNLILENTYNCFDGVPKKLCYFMRNFLNFPSFPNGAEIITLPGWLDRRGHVTEGQIDNTKVILKRSLQSNDPNERKTFYEFMDTAKEKLRDLAAIANDHTLSEEEKKLRTKQIRRQLSGLGNIVPIVGITQIQRPDESSPGKFIDETIEILPKVNGHTLHDCIEKKLPPYDTPRGIPRNQNIAIQLLLQLTQAMLSLHSCGYTRGDSNPKNIMIAKNGSSFAVKLIDWDHFIQTEEPSDFTKDIRNMNIIFRLILLGRQRNACRVHFPNQKADEKKNFLQEFFHFSQKAGIYSPQAIGTMVQLFKDILWENDAKKPDLEAIISKLEELLNENKLGNDMAEKNNDENPNENKEKSGEE